MDDKFLEFLGNFYLNAAKSRKHYNDLMKFTREGFSGFDELKAMFCKFYGLDQPEKDEDSSDHLKAWNKAAEKFQESMKEYMKLMGMVPREDYVKLVKKYEELKKRVADQEETIRHLQMLLGEKNADQGETVRVFENLMEKQSKQFMEMMNTVGKYFQKEQDEKE